MQAPRLDASVPLAYDHMPAFDGIDVSGLNALLDSMETDSRAGWVPNCTTGSMVDGNNVSAMRPTQRQQCE